MIECFFDGSVHPHNPGGHGGYGMIIRQDCQTIYSEAVYIGRWRELSVNVAEYAGVISVLRYLLKEGIEEARICGDAEIVVQQLNGKWKAKSGAYLPYYREAYALRVRIPKVKIEWIPREMNYAADELSKIGVRKRVVGFALNDLIQQVAAPKIPSRKRTRSMVRDIEKLWSK